MGTKQRIRRMAGYGLGIGAIFSAWVLFLSLSERSLDLTTQGHQVNAFAVVALYLVGGLLGGALTGLLSPLAKSRFSAALVGTAVAFPLVCAGQWGCL